MKHRNSSGDSERIDVILSDQSDWRKVTLARMRILILEAIPDAIEELKWAKASNPDGVPVWSLNGIICTGEMYKDKVKLTFAKGASLPDLTGLFNAQDNGATRRAIDIRKGDSVNAEAFRALVTAAAQANTKPAKP